MAVTHGMNIEEVRALGQDLQTRAATIDELMGTVERVVVAANWVGPDARRFKDQWWPEHRARLQKVSEDLRGFGQSALNNASEQEQASGGISAGSGVAPGFLRPQVEPPGDYQRIEGGAPGATSGSLSGSGRSWREVQAAFEGNPPPNYGPGSGLEYQCTSWVQYRWRELGYTPTGHGDGWQVAANNGGTVDTPPSLGAIASYGNGQEGSYGHVMIVEEVGQTADGLPTVRVSEMNTGNDGSGWQSANPEEYRSDRVFTQQPDGTWMVGGRNVGPITFAGVPSG